MSQSITRRATKVARSNRRSAGVSASSSPNLLLEPLETRRLMADISWVNRGVDDGFEVYGAKAEAARQLVDIAISNWAFVIQNFNYTDTSHANRFELRIYGQDTSGQGLAYTSYQHVDAQGKPYKAEITLDDNAQNLLHGWFMPEKWLGPNSFTSKSDFYGQYTVSGAPTPVADFYSTVLHEIGHAGGMGHGSAIGGNLRITQDLTSGPNNTKLFNRNGTTATFTNGDGGHLIGVTDLMNTSTGDRTRWAITPLDAKILRDGYGYDVWNPDDLTKVTELPDYWGSWCNYYNLTLPPGYGCVSQPLSSTPQLQELLDITANEGDLITFDAMALDDDPGSTFKFSLVDAPAGATIHQQTGEFSFTPTDGPGTYTFKVKVGDGGGCGCGGPSDTTLYDTEEVTITVNNLAPTAAVASPAVAVRGQHVPFTLTATDASSVDAAAGFQYLVDWGDGTTPELFAAGANNGAGKVVDHAYASDDIYTVKVTAMDKDGAISGEATRQITIASSAVLPDPADPTKLAFFLGGTTGNDTIRVTPKGFTVNGTPTAIPPEVGRLVVFGSDGNDVIDANGTFDLPVILDGGAGNDTVTGGTGNDILLGSAGSDVLRGHLGRDMLIGGADADDLNGQADDDILIGGSTVHDQDPVALSALMKEWTRTDLPAVQRVAHLQTGGAGAFNGTTLLDAASLVDDGALDALVGGPGENWLL